ncbi:MAG: hypothetical protein ACTS9Y_14730 [Methylophilus sp.]|uniref:hypothetical protein n=1 Tax=Methylophilus sp. TaxID=29541 RepID=UPI003FA035FB
MILLHLIKNLSHLIIPHKLHDGGTKSRTQSGDLRWSYSWKPASDVPKVDQFRKVLISPALSHALGIEARKMRALPEAQMWPDSKWVENISPEGERFLRNIQLLHDKKPDIAIRVIAILASIHHQLKLCITARDILIQRFRQKHPSSRAGIEIGFIIYANWPYIAYGENQIADALLDLLVDESLHSPTYVCQVTHALRHRSGTGESHGYVFSTLDSLDKSLLIAQALKTDAPDYTRAVYMRYLFEKRNDHTDSSQAHRLKITHLVYESGVLHPFPDQNIAGIYFNNLLRYGSMESPAYAQALNKLFALACETSNPDQAMIWFRTIYINSIKDMVLKKEASLKWLYSIRLYLHADMASPLNALRLSAFLLQTSNAHLEENALLVSRNPGIQVDIEDELIKTSLNEFWKLMDHLQDNTSADFLCALAEAMMQKNHALGNQAQIRFESAFRHFAEKSPESAASALAEMAKYHYYTNVDRNTQQRCLTAYKNQIQILESISPKAAKFAKDACTNPAYLR